MGGSLYDNLIDARCSEELCERCSILAKRGQTAQMLFLLRGHRKELLDHIHEQQKALACLFLASDMGRHVKGQVIRVCNGAFL